jgi:hypothetical protein
MQHFIQAASSLVKTLCYCDSKLGGKLNSCAVQHPLRGELGIAGFSGIALGVPSFAIRFAQRKAGVPGW